MVADYHEDEFTYMGFTGIPVANPSTLRWHLTVTNTDGVTLTADNITFGLVTQDIRAAIEAYHKERRTGT
jgi:hypothetical protein